MILPAAPYVEIENDRSDRIMARSGQITAISRKYVLWRFGFLVDSDSARAFGCSVARFVWVLCTHESEIVEVWHGMAFGMPEKMKRVEKAKLWPTR